MAKVQKVGKQVLNDIHIRVRVRLLLSCRQGACQAGRHFILVEANKFGMAFMFLVCGYVAHQKVYHY